MMIALRRLKKCILVYSLAIGALALLWIEYNTNIFDLVVFHLSLGFKTLPLSLHCNDGRLGNQMCTYATLYGISALNYRNFHPLPCNLHHLTHIFVGPSKVRTKSYYIRFHPWNILPYFKSEDAVIPQNSNFLDGWKHSCSYTFFDHVRDEIRREFQFKEPYTNYAQDILRQANVQKLPNVTYVGVHVRRGDYAGWIAKYKGLPVNMVFFNKSTHYFRSKYKNVIFVGVSDDRTWCIENLSRQFGVYVAPSAPSPAHDLALLANCNHTVMTYGTFGFWAAYLAGGEVLYFDKFLKSNTSFLRQTKKFEKFFLPNWKGIVTVNLSHSSER